MLNLKLKERRLNTRRKLTGLLPGKILLAETEKEIACRPVDISRDGLGILSEVILERGTLLRLKGKDLDIEMKVMWDKKDFGKQDRYRYGLVATDTSVQMEEIFSAAGCLK